MKHIELGNQRYISGILGELYVMFHVAQKRGLFPKEWRYRYKSGEIDLIYNVSRESLIFIEVRTVIVSHETDDFGAEMTRMMPEKKKRALFRACASYVIRETASCGLNIEVFCAIVGLNKNLSLRSINFHKIYENK